MIQIILYTFAILIGLCVGSFLNVLIYRMPLEKNVVFPPSACPKCETPLRWFHNIPLLSFIFLKGKCSFCFEKISWRYPLVEILNALFFLLIVIKEPQWIAWPFHAYLLSSLLVATFIDLDHWIIPDLLTLPGIVIGLIGSVLIPNQIFFMHFLGTIIGGGILLFLAWAYEFFAKREGLGGGDIKFLAMVGAFLGVQGALSTLIMSSLLGSIIGIFLILVKGRGAKTAIPFGPFLALGTLFTFLLGDSFWQWYFQFGR